MMKFFLFIVSILFFVNCNSPNKNITQKQPLYDYDVEEKIKALGIQLSTPNRPIANYVDAVKTGNLVFLSGTGPKTAEGTFITGKVGVDLTVEEGYRAARLTGIQQLSFLKAQLGDLNKVVKIVKVLGWVNANDQFNKHPQVINGFSDLMVDVFGERGRHARAAVGVASLPMNIACEIEMIVEVNSK